MNNRRKWIAVAVAALMTVGTFAGCSNNSNETSSTADNISSQSSSEQANTADFDAAQEIGVITREDGSGTRGAFIELFGVEQKNEAGEKVDYTTKTAVTTNSTSVMMTTVAGDEYSIGYISLGSLNDTVKAVKIDGAEASVANVENGSYKIVRPFNIVVGENLSAAAQDFIDFIMSADGQAVVEENGYIAVSDAPAYSGSVGAEKIVVSGSSSVTPVMEKLKEAYLAKNPDATVEVQQSDSSTGVSDTIDGSCDIGMASRELKDSEIEQGVSSQTIAMDGIAVIINNDNPVEELTSEQVKGIFTGETLTWDAVISK